MLKLDLSAKVKGEDGKQGDSHITLAEGLAGLLFKATQVDDPIKFYRIGEDLRDNKTTLVDTSDIEKLKAFVKSHRDVPVIWQAQLLQAFGQAKEAK